MSCNCSDCTTVITALTGATGSSGTSVGVTTGGFSTSATSLEYVYTTNRLTTANNALNYNWEVITVPAVPTANVAIFEVNAQVNATGSHTLTMTAIENGSGAPVPNVSCVQVCETSERVSWRFEVANVVQGQVYVISFVTSDLGVAPALRSGNTKIEIFG